MIGADQTTEKGPYSLENAVGITIRRTASFGAKKAHFLSLPGDLPAENTKSAEFILSDLVEGPESMSPTDDSNLDTSVEELQNIAEPSVDDTFDDSASECSPKAPVQSEQNLESEEKTDEAVQTGAQSVDVIDETKEAVDVTRDVAEMENASETKSMPKPAKGRVAQLSKLFGGEPQESPKKNSTASPKRRVSKKLQLDRWESPKKASSKEDSKHEVLFKANFNEWSNFDAPHLEWDTFRGSKYVGLRDMDGFPTSPETPSRSKEAEEKQSLLPKSPASVMDFK